MGSIMKKKLFIILAIIIAVILCITGVKIFQYNKMSSKETAYYIIHSDMLKKSGGIVGIDSEGNVTNQKSLKIQDISKYDLVKDTFIAGGNRSNNNLLINTQGEIVEFNLLDNPNYSGVTAITIYDENIVAVMNGNISGNTYQNLFVLQDKQGKVLEKKIIDIYASDIYCENNIIYIVGSYFNLKEDQWSSKIVQYDLSNSQIKENIIDIDSEYREVVSLNGKLYCTVADMNGYIKKLDILDKNSLDRLNSFDFNKNIDCIFEYNNFLYGVLDNTICKIELNGSLSKLNMLPEKTYVSASVMKDNHIYLFSHSEVKEKKHGKTKFGFLVDYNLEDNSIYLTPLTIKNKNCDNIIFYPVIEN